MLRNLHTVRATDESDDDIVFEFLVQQAEYLTGLRRIDWYFRRPDCEPLERLMVAIGRQLEHCCINNSFECGFFDHMDPKVLKSLEFTVSDNPDSVPKVKTPGLEHLCVTGESNSVTDFAASLNSLISLSVTLWIDIDLIDIEGLVQSIRSVSAANPKLRRLQIDAFCENPYDFLRLLLLGTSSPEDLVLNDLKRLVQTRLGISPEALSIYDLTVWAVFHLRAPPEQFKKATDIEAWRHYLDICHQTESDKLVALGRFMLRLCDPEIFEDKTLVDLYIAPIESALDDLLATERRYDPQLKTSSIACALLHWGGLLLLRSPEDPEVKKRVVERCSSTLQHTPNLLEVCSDAYSYEFDMNWITSPAVHLVMELAEWYDPTTLVLKEPFSTELQSTHQVLLAMVVHPKFNFDVKTRGGDHLCRAMLQSLLDTYVIPGEPSYDAAYLVLAKMCASRNLKIQTSNLSAYSLKRMFASDEMLELFSRLADNISHLSDIPNLMKSRFVRSEQFLRGVCFMFKKMEERKEHAAEQIAACRRSIVQPIWDTFLENRYSSSIYDFVPNALEYVFEICPDVPDSVVDFLEKADSDSYVRRRLVSHMKTDNRLRKYLSSKEGATQPAPSPVT